jgi:uncharacterized protein YceH (UPF0502 family)
MAFDNVEVGQQVEGTSAPIGMTSFEDVQEITEKVEAATKAEKTEANKEVAKVAEKIAEKVAKKLDKDVEDPAVTADPPVEGDVVKAKPITAYDHEGKAVELNPDLEIEVKVDGKIEKMKLSDVRNEISGKTNWDRKNNEFHKEKKGFQDQVKFVNEQVDNILKMAIEKPEAALFELARLAGKSPTEYAQMLAGTMEGAARWSEMSQAEQKAMMLEAENTGFKADMERRKKIEDSSRQEIIRNESINALANELKLEENEIQGLVQDIQKHTDIAQPNAEHIYTAWLYKNTHEAFNLIAPESLKANPSLYNETANILLSNGIRNREDIESIIKQAYGDEDSARKVGRKVASQAPKTAIATTQSKKQEIVSFDEI